MISRHPSSPMNCLMHPRLRTCAEIPPPCLTSCTNTAWGFKRHPSCCAGSECRQDWKPRAPKAFCSLWYNRRAFSPLEMDVSSLHSVHWSHGHCQALESTSTLRPSGVTLRGRGNDRGWSSVDNLHLLRGHSLISASCVRCSLGNSQRLD